MNHPVPSITHGSYPKRSGNLVHPLVDSGPAFRRICEAVESAQHSVWLTVAFVAQDFQMPGGRGSLFDLLDAAARRGLDVRVIFWRPNPESEGYGQVFAGSEADFKLLAARGARFYARWDRAALGYCHHQKTWLIDAGRPAETAFVGGINLTSPVVEPGHTGDRQRHDIYAEITGPSATDVHHNFVQRWNESSERHTQSGRWGHDGDEILPFPTCVSDACGPSTVQVQRNIHAGCYLGSHPAPECAPYHIAAGERSITDQFILAIKSARRSIYIENQALPIPMIADPLARALKRGVQVVLLVPDEPVFGQLEKLRRYPNFTLAGIAGKTTTGERKSIYVHAKIMLVDDAWATIGSCNLHSNSLYGHSEMNVAVWDPDFVRALRRELFLEHLGQDTQHLDDYSAMQLYQRIATENSARWQAGDPHWHGLVYKFAGC